MISRRKVANSLLALGAAALPASAQKTKLERGLEYVINARGALASPAPGPHHGKALALINSAMRELQLGIKAGEK